MLALVPARPDPEEGPATRGVIERGCHSDQEPWIPIGSSGYQAAQLDA
jgi:hypothetical protein